ncbi:MAG: cytidine deaminase [bacterium]|nr:cytidine deaminase [bacterium]
MKKEQILFYLTKAAEVLEKANANYSHFPVGSVVLLESGDMYVGANVESSSYGLSICAERVALTSALTASRKKIVYIFVIADCEVPVPPCGACRQLLYDYAKDAKVIYSNLTFEYIETTVKDLLPNAFHSDMLNQSQSRK